MHKKEVRILVEKLRKAGKTYSEIQRALPIIISKSTVSLWARKIPLSENQKMRITKIVDTNIRSARVRGLETNRKKHALHLKKIRKSAEIVRGFTKSIAVSKAILGTLYLGEGSKTRRSFLTIGNSNPEIIRLFLTLFRQCYSIDEKKFRCTVQCRADQNARTLELFWARITHIPPAQFYATRVDPRSVGQKTRKPDYKGVCRIDYFSADIYNELKFIGEVMIQSII